MCADCRIHLSNIKSGSGLVKAKLAARFSCSGLNGVTYTSVLKVIKRVVDPRNHRVRREHTLL